MDAESLNELETSHPRGQTLLIGSKESEAESTKDLNETIQQYVLTKAPRWSLADVKGNLESSLLIVDASKPSTLP